MSQLRRLLLVAAAAATVAVLGAPAAAGAVAGADPATVDGTSSGTSVPAGTVAGTQCDFLSFRQDAPPCRTTVAGSWTGTGGVQGTYRGSVTLTAVPWDRFCVKASGALTYVARSSAGRQVGRVKASIDRTVSLVCQHEPVTRTYVLHTVLSGGTGVLAGVGGELRVEGRGDVIEGTDTFTDELTLTPAG